mgnify:FL=1
MNDLAYYIILACIINLPILFFCLNKLLGPINYKTYLLTTYLFTLFSSVLGTILAFTKVLVLKNFIFLPRYYSRNENLWVDGFILDFLQKKSADLLIRKFIIYTGFIFSERLVFDSVVRIYLDNVLWPAHYTSLSEAGNVLEMLSTSIFFYFYFFGLVTLSYVCFF